MSIDVGDAYGPGSALVMSRDKSLGLSAYSDNLRHHALRQTLVLDEGLACIATRLGFVLAWSKMAGVMAVRSQATYY